MRPIQQIFIVPISLISLLMLFVTSHSVVAKRLDASLYPKDREIRVACVGNSVTFGAGISDRENCSYPVVLQQLLGDRFHVENFGRSGATLLSNGHRPYTEQEEFKKALEFKPDVVVIHLGLNDTDPRSWQYQGEFIKDYVDLINRFKDGTDDKGGTDITDDNDCNVSPEVWICSLTPILSGHKRFNSGTRDWFWKLQDKIDVISKTQDVGFIDIHSSLYGRPDLLPDNLHPNAEGAKLLAERVYSGLTGDFGGLQMSFVYSDAMVLQRNVPIPIKGVANAGDIVTVEFAGSKKSVATDQLGNWSVEFPKMDATVTPMSMSIYTDERSIVIKDILIGEVWLASGQSNMVFQMQQALEGADEYKSYNNKNIRLLQLDRPNAPRVWGDSLIGEVKRGRYFQIPDSWSHLTPESSAGFSAVAWYFAKKIYDDVNVPVGVVCNAIGGSPTQSWINRRDIELHPQLNLMLDSWWNNDFTDSWAQGRALTNLNEPKSPKGFQHPFMPAYLYEYGVKPLVGFPIKGVLWYQGESNADRVDLHEVMFTTLVESWRDAWGYEFPFYYVQLSSLNRQTWPEFRDSQRELLDMVPNSGMAVSSDVGNRTDVHPKRKRPVGERLALIAEANLYGLNVEYSGPVCADVLAEDGELSLVFNHADGLTTSDGEDLRGFEIAGEDQIFYPATALVNRERVELSSEKVDSPIYVRYGWKPYSDANLVNESGLPMSTFTNINNR